MIEATCLKQDNCVVAREEDFKNSLLKNNNSSLIMYKILLEPVNCMGNQPKPCIVETGLKNRCYLKIPLSVARVNAKNSAFTLADLQSFCRKCAG